MNLLARLAEHLGPHASKTDGPVQAVWNGAVLAESDETILVEGKHYFPPSSLRREHFVTSARNTNCAWKGRADYYTIEVDGERNEAAAWTYPRPKAAAAQIRDYVAFWHGVKIVPAD